MTDNRAERFVSADFAGVTLVKGEGRGSPLLANRVPKRISAKTVSEKAFGVVSKADLVQSVARETGLTQDQARRALEGTLSSISAALKNGQDVRLVGFGTFTAAKRKAGTARNPRTGEPINIASSKKAKFKAGKGLQAALDESA